MDDQPIRIDLISGGTDFTGAFVYGRSDATINRHGERISTAELYRAVEALREAVNAASRCEGHDLRGRHGT